MNDQQLLYDPNYYGFTCSQDVGKRNTKEERLNRRGTNWIFSTVRTGQFEYFYRRIQLRRMEEDHTALDVSVIQGNFVYNSCKICHYYTGTKRRTRRKKIPKNSTSSVAASCSQRNTQRTQLRRHSGLPLVALICSGWGARHLYYLPCGQGGSLQAAAQKHV